MKKVFISAIILSVLASSGLMIAFRFSSYEEVYGLFRINLLLHLSLAFLILAIGIALCFSVILYKKAFLHSDKEKRAISPTTNLVRVDSIVRKAMTKEQIIFFVASLMILLSSSILRLLSYLQTLSIFDGVLFILSIGLLWGCVRYLLINLLGKIKKFDSVILLAPTVFNIVYSFVQYRDLATRPQAVIYTSETLSVVFVLLGFFMFASHYFGRRTTGLSLFTALSMASCCSITYLCDVASLGRAILSDSNAIVMYSDVAKLLFYAASAIIGIIYSSMLTEDGSLK